MIKHYIQLLSGKMNEKEEHTVLNLPFRLNKSDTIYHKGEEFEIMEIGVYTPDNEEFEEEYKNNVINVRANYKFY